MPKNSNANNNQNKEIIEQLSSDYKYGFHTDTPNIIDTGKGISLEVVEKISEIKNEPLWMKEIRKKAYLEFAEKKWPNFGPDLSFLNFDEYTYYIKSTLNVSSSWESVPVEIKDTFDKLGIREAEQKYLAGVSTQFESEVVYHNTIEELEKERGISKEYLLSSLETALVTAYKRNFDSEENVKVTKYVSSIDVLPTIYNLFGIKYDSRLLMGRDALSDAEGLVILSDRSFINEFGSYNSITGKYTKFKEDVSNDYIEKLNHEVYQRFTMSSLLLYEKNGVYLDYYRKLGLYED